MVKNNALRIGKLGDVSIYVGWSWLLVLWLDYNRNSGPGGYSKQGWIFAEVGAFMAMVCLYELTRAIFGVLTGGSVSEVHISFLGRGSNLAVPQRPGPVIITSLGGILGYTAILGLTIPLFYALTMRRHGSDDAAKFALHCLYINVFLSAWAVIPVYPLEGGKILRALLWYVFGRIRSLQIACVLGLFGVLGIIGLTIWIQQWWTVFVAVLIGLQCFYGFREAKFLGLVDKLPRRTDVTCPHCKQNPLFVNTINCVCGRELDPFDTRGLCGNCGSVTALYACPNCNQQSAIANWFGPTGVFEVQGVEAAAVTPAKVSVVAPIPLSGDEKE